MAYSGNDEFQSLPLKAEMDIFVELTGKLLVLITSNKIAFEFFFVFSNYFENFALFCLLFIWLD